MTNEQSFFLKTIENHINKGESVYQNVDVNTVSNIALKHELSPIIFFQLRKLNIPVRRSRLSGVI